MRKNRLMGVIIKIIAIEIDKIGVWFPYKGDTIVWNWPWRHRKIKERFISVSFSGTGEFGDARFYSLEEIDKEWNKYFYTCSKHKGLENIA